MKAASSATYRALASNLAVALAVNFVLALLIAWLVLPSDAPLSAPRMVSFVDFVRLVPARDAGASDAREHLPPPPTLTPRPALPAPALSAMSAASAGVSASPTVTAAVALPTPAPMPLDAASLTAAALGPATNAGAGAAGAQGGGGGGAGSGDGGAAMQLRADEIEVNLTPAYRAAPSYPLRALKEGIEGVVTVEFAIDTEGNVRDPRVVKADPPELFDAAVLAALPRWKFSPRLVDGRPVARRARQDVVFRLHRQ